MFLIHTGLWVDHRECEGDFEKEGNELGIFRISVTI